MFLFSVKFMVAMFSAAALLSADMESPRELISISRHETVTTARCNIRGDEPGRYYVRRAWKYRPSGIAAAQIASQPFVAE